MVGMGKFSLQMIRHLHRVVGFIKNSHSPTSVLSFNKGTHHCQALTSGSQMMHGIRVIVCAGQISKKWMKLYTPPHDMDIKLSQRTFPIISKHLIFPFLHEKVNWMDANTIAKVQEWPTMAPYGCMYQICVGMHNSVKIKYGLGPLVLL